MRLLLDTHAFVWAVGQPDKLSARARKAIADGRNELFGSAASAWEVSTKFRLGKLPHAAAIVWDFGGVLVKLQSVDLPVSATHALCAGAYPQAHRDPFDRMLAAQAEVEGLTLVSRDRAFDTFGVERLW
ncbi:MAG TPA: type II toxin-antitoxin system VapC family toxin [Nevskiaceae bacterium]|nr:type II toxin-antitoxin system VapC family toxin [Nevskiaceae bacterium]